MLLAYITPNAFRMSYPLAAKLAQSRTQPARIGIFLRRHTTASRHAPQGLLISIFSGTPRKNTKVLKTMGRIFNVFKANGLSTKIFKTNRIWATQPGISVESHDRSGVIRRAGPFLVPLF
jgi:hypothetical protein